VKASGVSILQDTCIFEDTGHVTGRPMENDERADLFKNNYQLKVLFLICGQVVKIKHINAIIKNGQTSSAARP
jgi:hypothetical protein